MNSTFSSFESPLVLNRASEPAGFDPAAMHQLAPLGEHRGTMPAPNGGAPISIIQVIDAEAVEAMVKNFSPSTEMLVDYEHQSHDTEKDTTAAAWINQLKTDPKEGLLFGGRWSDRGLKDVKGLNYRFISPEFPVSGLVPLGGNRYRPTRISGAGLTNRPQLKTLRPLSNREDNNVSSGSENQNPSQMKNVNKELGLAEDASEASTLAEVQKLKNRATTAETNAATVLNRATTAEGEVTTLKAERAKLLDVVIEADLNAHADVILNRDAVKAQLVLNREGTLALLGALKKPVAAVVGGPGTAPAVHNRDTGAGAGAVTAITGKGAEKELTGRARTEAALKKQRETAAAKA